MLITVVTPTFNRAHTLHRPFNSLQRQTNKNFEWIIIDDGSNDNTKELVETFKQKALFEITYHYKENGGRHTALNESYKYIKTKYVVNLDSDDEFVDDAIQKMIDIWNSVPSEKYDSCWCIVGRCIDSGTRDLVGDFFSENINELNYGYKKDREVYKVKGEMSCCRKTDILRQYPFPVYTDTRFIREGIVWGDIDNKYDRWFTNEVFRVYYQNEPDSLVVNNRKRSLRGVCSEYYYSVFCINKQLHKILYNKNIKNKLINVTRMGFLSGRKLKDILMDIEKFYLKFVVFCLSPIGFLIYLKERKGYHNE